MLSGSGEVLRTHAGSRIVLRNGRTVDYYCGCDYLGMQTDLRVREAVGSAVREFGMTGHVTGGIRHPLLELFESALERFTGCQSVITYPTNYLGTAVILDGLTGRFDAVLVDRESHYSAFDALRDHDVQIARFEHRSVDDFRRVLGQLKPGVCPLIITDGVFPVSGEIAPLPEYRELLSHVPEWYMCVDDAHSVGVLGSGGRGTLDYFGLNHSVNCHSSATMSKALGARGGFISGDRAFIEDATSRSTVLTGATAVSVPDMAAAIKSFELIGADPSPITRLAKNALRLKEGLRALGFRIPETSVPIVNLTFEQDFDCLKLRNRLYKRGMLVRYFRPREYSSAPDDPSIRIAVFAGHTDDQIDRLVDTIGAEIF